MGTQWAYAPGNGAPCLLLGAGARRAAVPIEAVVETMRPLPIAPLPGMPGGLLGVAIVRSTATLVADLATLLGEPKGASDRWVSLRLSASARPLALAARVIGVRALDRDAIEAGRVVPTGVAATFVDAIVAHEGQALAILDVGRILGDVCPGDDRGGAWPR